MNRNTKNPTAKEQITLEEARNLAEQEKLTLRQLRGVLPSTDGVKTPSRDWVRENLDGDQVFFAKQYPNECSLVVFTNGFYFYGDRNWTILRVDGFSRIYYETDEKGGYKSVAEADFIDDSFIPALGMNALWQLKRNAKQRKSNTNESAVDSTIIEGNADESTPDILDFLIAKEEKTEERESLQKAWTTLTDQQKAVIWLVKVKKLSQDEVAKRLGVSRPRVTMVLKQTIEKLRKNFGKV